VKADATGIEPQARVAAIRAAMLQIGDPLKRAGTASCLSAATAAPVHKAVKSNRDFFMRSTSIGSV